MLPEAVQRVGFNISQLQNQSLQFHFQFQCPLIIRLPGLPDDDGDHLGCHKKYYGEDWLYLLLSDAELTNFRCCCWSKWYGDFSVVQLKKTIPVEFLAKPNCNFIEQCSYAIWRPLILSAKKNSQPLFDCRSRYNSAYQFEQFSSWNFGFDMTVWIKAALTVVIAHELSKRLLIGAWLLKV